MNMMDQASKLRSMVSDKNNDKTFRIYSVLGGEEKLGKTNFAMNLAIEYKKRGYNVLYLDATGEPNNLKEHINLSQIGIIEDNMDYILNIQDYVVIGPNNINILLGAEHLINIKNINQSDKDKIFQQIKNVNKYDIVIIDNKSGVCDNLFCFVDFSNQNILLTGPEVDNILKAYSLLKIISTNHRDNVNIVVNNVSNDNEHKQSFEKLNDTASRFLTIRLKDLGYLSQDENLADASKLGKSISIYNDKVEYVRNLNQIIENLESEEYKENNFTVAEFERQVKAFFK